MDSFQDIMQYLVSGKKPITNISEIAVVMCVARSTAYGYKNEGYEPKFSQIKSLNKFLIEQKGCHIIKKAFGIKKKLTPNDRIRAIKEELTALEAEINRK